MCRWYSVRVCLSVFTPVTACSVSPKATLLPDALALVPHTEPARLPGVLGAFERRASTLHWGWLALTKSNVPARYL